MKDLVKSLLLCYLITAGVIWPLSSFNNECKHIYVSTIPAEVKIEQAAYNPMGGMGMLDLWPVRQSGKKEGQEIVCVKCHHVTRQILDYGPAPINSNSRWRLGSDGTLIFDTIVSKPIIGHILYVDTIGVLRTQSPKKKHK